MVGAIAQSKVGKTQADFMTSGLHQLRPFPPAAIRRAGRPGLMVKIRPCMEARTMLKLSSSTMVISSEPVMPSSLPSAAPAPLPGFLKVKNRAFDLAHVIHLGHRIYLGSVGMV